MSQIILASQSPRRKVLLEAMGLQFSIVPSSYDEQLDESRSPLLVARELALGKALDVAKRFPDAYVIGSDTIVWCDGKQLGKPKDAEDARAMLEFLGGREHYVTTGVAIVCEARGIELVSEDTAKVFFKPYDEQVALEYIATGDPMDKAGSYGVQSSGDYLVQRIEGAFDTVVGLPTELLAAMLMELDIAAHPAPSGTMSNPWNA
jgi:septum formation protein